MPAPSQQTPAPDESFGGRLRRERERRQIPIASIADNWKISASHFEDLERDDVSRWPSGIFRRSFIRAYAKAVGLDVEATTREFLERFPDPHEAEIAAAGAQAPAAPPSAADAAATPGVTKPAPVPASAPAGAAIRVTVVDNGTSFVPGPVLPSVRDRVTAVACDAAVVITLGLALYAVLGTLWMPLCVVIAGYYGGGILLLGNTPGVCFNAPGDRPHGSDHHHQKPVDFALP